MFLADFIWFGRHSFSIIFGIWESFMDHLGVGLFVCLFVCLPINNAHVGTSKDKRVRLAH